MEYSLLLFILGLLFLLGGVTWVHKVSKAHGFLRRIGAVSMSMMGCFLIWLCAAFNVPAIVNEKVEIISAGPNWMILELKFERARECKESLIDAILIDGNNQVEIESNVVHTIIKDGVYYGFVTISNEANIVPKFFFLELHHTCPLNINITTMTAKYKIPAEFNLATDDGLNL